MPNQSILSDSVYKVEEKIGQDTKYYSISLKDCTEVVTYEQVAISKIAKENVPSTVLCRIANGNIRRAGESD